LLFISEEQVRELLRLEDLIPALEQALVSFSAGLVRQPLRTIIPIEEHQAFLGVMPAVYGDVMGAKLVCVYPGNAARGLHTHLAMIHLFRSDTGEPLAAIDGRLITELRTAAVSALATKTLAPASTSVLAVLGSGVQARAHICALRLIRQFEDIRIWSRTPAHAERLAEEVGGKAVALEAAVRDADVVITVTNSPEPIVRGEWLKAGAYVNAVGAVGPTRRELDAQVMRSGPVIVESREAALRESGEIVISQVPVYAELGEILAGKKAAPTGRNIIFKSTGIAVEDLAAAKLVYDAFSGSGRRDL
jgi:ornithine cyclodeaminase/alanine dehydrogenase-like protein (mu-crystallin family)